MYRQIGKITSWTASLFGIAYVIITILGLFTLKSQQDPIDDPYFTLMEIFTILIAPLMAVSMVAVHDYASPNDKKFSLTAVLLMFIMAGITSCVHFVILTVSRYAEVEQLNGFSVFFSFKWPSIVYALDILAWDWFFALSILFAAPVFRIGRLEKIVRILMITSGLLSLAGLIGVPFNNMQVRNIGIIGYAVVAPFIFLLIGIVLHRTPSSPFNK